MTIVKRVEKEGEDMRGKINKEDNDDKGDKRR